LLKRASYLDLLMGEVRRSRQQGTPTSVLLMRFGDRTALAKDGGDTAIENSIQRLGQIVSANIRQNDLAFRYTANSIAIVLGETGEHDALLAVEKMRRVMAAASEKQFASAFNAGIAEAVLRQEYDAVDIVTELINRAERALEKAVTDGTGKSVALPPLNAAAAFA
jgi:diguanylate cyclase (GGDEF)-like protein